MKNSKYFLIIYSIFMILSIITVLTLYILGNKTRVGYISIDKKTKIEYFYCDEYNFAIRYYNSIFRNSDIYDVYVNTNDIIKNNNFITNIDIKGGEPFGIIIVDKMMSNDKIDNINYTLKIKRSFLINIFIINILILFVCLIYKLMKNNKIFFNKNDNYKYNINITYYIFFILLLALFVRIFWAYQQDGIYWDEWHSLNYTNKGLFADNDNINYVGIKGFDILKNLTIDDSSIKDCIDDIVRLYKNTDDPFISNLYYTLLRLSFIGREVVYIKNIIVTGTILNCIFFIISFIFIYKILKLIFEEKSDYIIFSLLIMSLSPISISFSMFLRPYQLQETFFVVITYFTIDTIYNNKYSIKNLIITTFIAGIGYITLYSSLLFVLILSAMLFINYIFTFKQLRKISFFTPLIEINSYKTIIYYAVSFISALFVSRLLYASFFSSLFNANNRASNSLKFSRRLFDYINDLSFNGLLPLLLVIVIIYFIFLLIKNKTLNITINKDKLKLLIFIILAGIIYAVLGDLSSPYKLERYSASSYILILFLYPLIFSIFYNRKIRYILFIIISLIYIYNITTSNRFIYFEKIDKDKYVLTENIPVYSYKDFIFYYNFHYLNTNLNYTYIEDYETLSKITNDKFYLMINPNYYEYNLFTNDIFTNKVSKLNTIGNTLILKIEKSNIVE